MKRVKNSVFGAIALFLSGRAYAQVDQLGTATFIHCTHYADTWDIALSEGDKKFYMWDPKTGKYVDWCNGCHVRVWNSDTVKIYDEKNDIAIDVNRIAGTLSLYGTEPVNCEKSKKLVAVPRF